MPIDFIRTLIDKAHEFHAKVESVEPDPGSNPSDEDMREVLEENGTSRHRRHRRAEPLGR